MMSRVSGYYWVKLDAVSNWEIARHQSCTETWHISGMSLRSNDEDFHKIHSVRILTPGEAGETQQDEPSERPPRKKLTMDEWNDLYHSKP